MSAHDLWGRGRTAILAVLAVTVAIAIAGCAAPPDLGESVRVLAQGGTESEMAAAARRVAASLNASACADVAAAAAGNPALETYIASMRTDLLDTTDATNRVERRIASIRCVQALGIDGAAEQVGYLASDLDESVRVAAVQALAADGTTEAADALVGSLADEDDDDVAGVKAAAIAALPDAMDRVITAFESASDESQTARLAGVARVAGADWVAPLTAQLTGEHATAARRMLVAIGQPAVGKLVPLLKSKKYAVRQAAAEILVEIERGAPGSVDRLMSSIRKKDYKDVARYYLFYIKLGKSGTEGVLRTALLKHGTKSMALDYLNCGNSKLEAAATTWAHRHGYIVVPGIGSSGGPTWGEGL